DNTSSITTSPMHTAMHPALPAVKELIPRPGRFRAACRAGDIILARFQALGPWKRPMGHSGEASSSPEDITELLLAWSEGNHDALEKLTPLVYGELRRLAHYYMAGERTGHTLQSTALVNEAYLRLVQVNRMQWRSRAHFFAVSAQLMRRILVDFARSRQYAKRGGRARKTSLEEDLIASPERGHDLVALDDALNSLTATYPRQSQVVELRFFGGLSVEETAEVLQVSTVTVMRDWQLAKVWLSRELKKRDPNGGTITAN